MRSKWNNMKLKKCTKVAKQTSLAIKEGTETNSAPATKGAFRRSVHSTKRSNPLTKVQHRIVEACSPSRHLGLFRPQGRHNLYMTDYARSTFSIHVKTCEKGIVER